MIHLDAQHVSVAAGALLLLGCAALFPKHRGYAVVAPILTGMALDAVAYPLLLELVMGSGSALHEPTRLSWSSFRDVGLFYALAPVIDTVPRGACWASCSGSLDPFKEKTWRT